jgi:hypothetical protein
MQSYRPITSIRQIGSPVTGADDYQIQVLETDLVGEGEMAFLALLVVLVASVALVALFQVQKVLLVPLAMSVH